ncbi:MAG: hypothetical protein AAB802_03355 [Patescibacteria group bacterium]
MKKISLFGSTLLVLAPAILSFLVGPMIWEISPYAPTPTSVQMTFFIILSAMESVAFGFGFLFLLEGKALLKNFKVSPTLTIWTYVAIAWSLMSWWVHDNLHKSNGGHDLTGLLYIEYGFHFTLVIAAGIIATYFVKSLKQN